MMEPAVRRWGPHARAMRIHAHTHTRTHTHTGTRAHGHPDTYRYVGTYLAFNLCYNVLIIFILKYGSSNILWLAMTIMVPLGNAAFALPFVPNHKVCG